MIPEPTVIELFPTPVLKFNVGRKFTPQELALVEECSKNISFNVHNTASVNRRILDEEPMADLRRFVLEAVDLFINRMVSPLTDIKPRVTQSWLNYTQPGEAHHSHSHGNSFLSGTLYFNADKEQDEITFINCHVREITILPKEFNKFNSATWTIPVETGDVVIFPSNLPHRVNETPKERTKTRISLAFNTYLTGALGTEESLTALYL